MHQRGYRYSCKFAKVFIDTKTDMDGFAQSLHLFIYALLYHKYLLRYYSEAKIIFMSSFTSFIRNICLSKPSRLFAALTLTTNLEVHRNSVSLPRN